jgi:hypothetical protein
VAAAEGASKVEPGLAHLGIIIRIIRSLGGKLWRQGCGKYLFPHQSPLSAAEFPRHSWWQHLGRIGREAQQAYIIINSLQTDM